jgi:predicted transcriptional regulator
MSCEVTGGEEKPMRQQLTVRISDEMAAKLEEAAHRLRRRRSEVMRLALERFLQGILGEVEEGSFRPIERVRDLLGQIESGIPDLGRRHREHLIERLRRSFRCSP